MNDSPYSAAQEHNRRAWDSMVQNGRRFTKPAKDEDFHDPLTTVDALGWLEGDIRGKQLLCLGAGGGRQSALYASAGAAVTVVDISPAMLELDRAVAAERGLNITTVEASMERLPGVPDAAFDVVIHPVSTCYVPDVLAVFREVARVTRAGGIYISQHKQPSSLQASIQPSPGGYELLEPYYRSGPLPQVEGTRLREDGTLEFLHRWEELVGGMCREGFVVEDLVEPMHAKPKAEYGSFAHRAQYLAPYVRIKAKRRGERSTASALWTP